MDIQEKIRLYRIYSNKPEEKYDIDITSLNSFNVVVIISFWDTMIDSDDDIEFEYSLEEFDEHFRMAEMLYKRAKILDEIEKRSLLAELDK